MDAGCSVLEMKAIVLCVAASVIACRPLRPGETRCVSPPIGGASVTNCRSGPPIQAEPPPYSPVYPAPARPVAAGWWCTVRDLDFGACFRTPGSCEVYRSAAPAVFAACGFATIAICADAGCYSAPSACAMMEREAMRDGAKCVAVE